MVALNDVRSSNSALRKTTPGLVAVFIGATAGIGADTLKELTSCLPSPIFYVVGRSEEKFARQRQQLQIVNPDARIVFLEAQVTLLKEIDRICKEIARRENHVDLLFMSAGFIPRNCPSYTVEGIDECQALSYYCRIRMTVNLLPLLQRSTREPRILSVLAGGKETKIDMDDLDLRRKDAYTTFAVINHTTTMHTLAFEYLERENRTFTFIHAYPGWVQTGILEKLFTPDQPCNKLLEWTLWILRIIAALGMAIFAITAKECGQRQAFNATSDKFASSAIRLRTGETPVGAYRLSWKSDVVKDNSILSQYRANSFDRKVWEHTLEVFKGVENCKDSS